MVLWITTLLFSVSPSQLTSQTRHTLMSSLPVGHLQSHLLKGKGYHSPIDIISKRCLNVIAIAIRL